MERDPSAAVNHVGTNESVVGAYIRAVSLPENGRIGALANVIAADREAGGLVQQNSCGVRQAAAIDKVPGDVDADCLLAAPSRSACANGGGVVSNVVSRNLLAASLHADVACALKPNTNSPAGGFAAEEAAAVTFEVDSDTVGIAAAISSAHDSGAVKGPGIS